MKKIFIIISVVFTLFGCDNNETIKEYNSELGTLICTLGNQDNFNNASKQHPIMDDIDNGDDHVLINRKEVIDHGRAG